MSRMGKRVPKSSHKRSSSQYCFAGGPGGVLGLGGWAGAGRTTTGAGAGAGRTFFLTSTLILATFLTKLDKDKPKQDKTGKKQDKTR